MNATPDRRARIAKVHVAKKQMALEEDSYRALLARVTGKNSCADCTDDELNAVLTEFRRLGFEPKTQYAGAKSEHAYVRMIYSLWSALKPYVKQHSGESLRAFVKRQTEMDAPEFCGPEEANVVIEGLKAWLERERGKRHGAGGKAQTKRRHSRPHKGRRAT